MINEIRMKNFKCYPDIDISLKEMNVLTGANASGKSTVIQALLLAYATIKEKKQVIDVNEALSIQVGNPSVLISQNPVDDSDADFCLQLKHNGKEIKLKYKRDLRTPLNLLYERDTEEADFELCYLNAERKGPRMSYPTGGYDTIYPDGSNAAYIVDQADFLNISLPKCVLIDGAEKFSTQVENWMDVILGDVQFSVSTDLTKASTDIRYRNSIVDHEVIPTMTGFGLSYIFSIITAGLWCTAKKNTILIVENPEAHLHPAAQSRMGKFLQLISNTGVQVIIETHSEHIIDGVRIQAALMERSASVGIQFFYQEDKNIQIKEITVDRNGELSDWPAGFFDQKNQDLRDLLSIRRKNAGK